MTQLKKIKAYVSLSTKSSQLSRQCTKNRALWVTLSSQTPLVGLPALPICNKPHASFSKTVKYWRHSSPLGISSLFATLQSGFGLQLPPFTHTRKQLDSWHSSEKCLQNVLTKNILTFVGYPCSNWKPVLFKTHLESVVPSAYIRKDNTEMRQLTPKQRWGTTFQLFPPTAHPLLSPPTNVKPTSRATCKNIIGTGHWPASSEK